MPGALSTPDETSTCRAPVRRIASATFCRGKPTGQHPRHRPSPSGDEPPVEGQPVPAGQVRPLRRFRIHENLIGHTRIDIERRKIIRIRHAHRLHDRQAETRPDLGHALGRLGAVELQHVDGHPVRSAPRVPHRPH